MKKLNITAITLFLLGLFTLILKCFTPEYVDSQGILREWFNLIPIGIGLILLSLCVFTYNLVDSKN